MPKCELQFDVNVSEDYFIKVCKTVLPTFTSYECVQNGNCFQVKEKTDLLNGTYGVTTNISYNNNCAIICASCGGLGPFQKRHVTEVAGIIKNVIVRGIEEGIVKKEDLDGQVRCPKCGSTQIQIQKRGWSLGTGLIGSGKNERVCMNCLYKF